MQNNIEEKLIKNGFSVPDDGTLSQISHELKNECEYGEHPDEGDDLHNLLKTILKINLPTYRMGDIYDDSDYKYITWDLRQLAFEYIKKNASLLNISEIERKSQITRTSLLNAINRNQGRFSNSDKLVCIFLRLVSS